jgi:Tfp pilus assembly protein PilX
MSANSAAVSAATQSGVGASQILSALQNIALALNTASTAYLNVNGQQTTTTITVPTVVKSSAGRVARVSVTVAGSSTGMIYDSAAVGVTTKPMYVIPNAVGTEPYVVNLATSFGALIVPGSGMTVAVGWS